MTNKDIRLLEEKIIEDLNSSQALAEVKRLVITNILNMITKQSDLAITVELRNESDTNLVTEKENDKNV